MEKYKELYEIAILAYKDQHSRYDILVDKATKYLSVLTLLIGLYSYLGKEVLDSLLNNSNKGFPEYALAVIGIALLIFLIVSWTYLFQVLRLEVLVVIPMNNETIDFYDNNKLIDIYFAMSKGIKDAMEQNSNILTYKSSLLTRAYIWLKYYTVLFVIFCIFYLISKSHLLIK